MTSTQDAVAQAPADAFSQMVETYAAVLAGPTRQVGPATAQDDLDDLLPSQDAIGASMETEEGSVVIVMMTTGLATELAGSPDGTALAAALQPVFDQVNATQGLGPRPVRAIIGAAQLSESIGDRPCVVSAGVFTGDAIDATVSVAAFSAASAGVPAASAPSGAMGAVGAAGPSTAPAMDSSILRRGLQLLADIHLDVTAQLGRAELTVSELLELTPGAVIELDRLAGQPLDLFVNGSLFARADVIVVDEAYAVQITEIVSDGVAT